MKRTAVGIGVLVALAVFLAAGMGAVAAQTQPTNETTGSGDAPFGASISSFMQASSAEAEGEVDDGMFEASLNRAETAEERRELVEQRQNRLRQRQQRLENRRAMLAESASDVRSRAIAAGVTTGAGELERSVNDTERLAEAVGANTTALEELRSEARNLSGGEVAELARGIGLGAAVRGGVGPPAGVGEEDRESGPIDVPGVGGDGPPGNEGAEPADRVAPDDGTEPGDETESDDESDSGDTDGTGGVEADPRRDGGGGSDDGDVGPPAGLGDDGAVGAEEGETDERDGDEE